MKIKKRGHYRHVSERAYSRKWKNLGYEIIEENKTDYEEEVEKYAVGGGWYDIPGVGQNIRGKDKAIEALKEADK